MEIFTLIGHGSIVGNFNFFAGSSMLCGGVRVEDNCFIGARALVIDGGRIEHHALIAGGATVRNAEAESVYFAPRAAKWHGKSSEIKI